MLAREKGAPPRASLPLLHLRWVWTVERIFGFSIWIGLQRPSNANQFKFHVALLLELSCFVA